MYSSLELADIAAGLVPGRSLYTIFGKSYDIQTSQVPFTLEPTNLLASYGTGAGESWRLRSTSVNDTLAGTGARTVAVIYLDASWNEVTTLVNLNGTTNVTLPGGSIYCFLQSMVVVAVGADATMSNLGDIILETPTPTRRGTIVIGDGVTRRAVYTVPAGYSFWAQNFFFHMGDPNKQHITVTATPYITFPWGVRIKALDVTMIEGGVPIAVPAGFSLPEKTRIEYRITQASLSGADIGLGISGVLTNVAIATVHDRQRRTKC